MVATPVEPNRIIRDAGYARRLEQACDASPHCPPLNRGRLTWLTEETGKLVGKKLTLPTAARWLNGESKPRPETNVKLAQLLGVDSIWLYHGVDPDMTPRERKVRNAMADGAVNLVTGLIQLDGGNPAHPGDNDAHAKKMDIDIYAVIKGAQYAFHVALGASVHGGWRFSIPADNDVIVPLGVVREGFNFRVVELKPELVEEFGKSGAGRSTVITLDDATIEANRIESFAQRL